MLGHQPINPGAATARVQAWPEAAGPTVFSPSSFSQLKAFKDEEKAKEALKQQKRKAKVRGLREEAAFTSLTFLRATV